MMRERRKRKLGFFMMFVTLCSIMFQPTSDRLNTIHAAQEDEHYYSQKGWTYNGKTLTSLCYITSYAMILKDMGYEVDPVDVYVANGCSNYVVHSKIASAYNVNVSETGDISSKSVKDKQAFVKALLEKYPQGIIVGGSYGNGTHYIVAKKVVGDEILFDDPAVGCCVSISKVYKHTWETLSMYRIIKEVVKETPTAKPTESAVPTATVKPTTTVKPTATVKPTTTVKPTATVVPTTTVKPTATVKPTEQPDLTESSVPASTVAPSEKNPLNKYKVPTRTIYYKDKNMTGEDVKWVELALKTLKYSISVDGKYTAKDRNIVKKYQKKKGLSPDGYFGKNTRKQVISDVEIAMTKVNQVTGLSVSKGTTASLLSATSTSSKYQITASWKKVTDVDGYQLIYSTKKDFSEKKTITKTGKSAIIKDLNEGTKYYIKVRAYKIVNKTKVYGAYSSVKTVK